MKKMFAAFLALLLLIASLPLSALGEGCPDWLNTDLDGAVGMLTSAKPQDDFHLSVNRRWLLLEGIYPGAGYAGPFLDQSSLVMQRQIGLMENPNLDGHDAELVRKLYALTLDWKTRNALGVEPLRPYVEEVRAIGSLEELSRYMTTEANVFYLDPSLYGLSVDPSHPGRYIVTVAPLPLILGDSAEYETMTDYGEMIRDYAEETTVYILTKLGYSKQEAQEIFDGALAYEGMLAPYIHPESAQYAPDYLGSLLNYYDRAELDALCGAFPMGKILDNAGMGGSEVFLVPQPAYFTGLSGLYTEENVPLVKDWLIYYLAQSVGMLLDRQTYLDLYEIRNTVTGASGEPDDLDIVYQTVTGMLPIPMDNLYIRAYCTEKTRRNIRALIEEIIAEYRVMLAEEEWLSPETREKAIDKLDHIRIHAVYPDTLEDWSALEFKGPEEGGTMLDAMLAINQFQMINSREKINQPVDKDAWDQASIPASETNASYDSTANSINILAGILGDVFYSPDMRYEEMLGGIGTVIGHEISHAFDSTGANFDQDGVVSNWWTQEDYEAFLSRAQKVSDYYDAYVPYRGGVYSGQRVRDEAIADMSGMKCALRIAAKHENFDYDAFFRQYARLWRTKMTSNNLIITVATDSHPLGCLRTNVTVQQFDEFLETYQVKPGDKMYLAPEERILVW